jgi:hypothetical protein
MFPMRRKWLLQCHSSWSGHVTVFGYEYEYYCFVLAVIRLLFFLSLKKMLKP